jgi:hypothetical protein
VKLAHSCLKNKHILFADQHQTATTDPSPAAAQDQEWPAAKRPLSGYKIGTLEAYGSVFSQL